MHELTALLRQIADDVAAIRASWCQPAHAQAEEMPAWLRNTLFSDPGVQASAPASPVTAAPPLEPPKP